MSPSRPGPTIVRPLRPTVVLTLDWRCPVCHHPFYESTLRYGQTWVHHARSKTCSARYLAIALPPGATGAELTAIIGDRLGTAAIRRYLPIADHLPASECARLPLVAWDAPGPAYCLIGPVLSGQQRDHSHAPVTTIVRVLGLEEAA